FEGVVEIARLDYDQHWAEDFFLFQLRLRGDVGNHGRLNEVAAFGTSLSVARAAGDEASIFFADFDVAENVVHRTFIDDGSHVRVCSGIADGNALGAGL